MDKTHVCEIPGCGKAYYDKKNLRRHEKEKHGRLSMTKSQQSSTLPEPHEYDSCGRNGDETEFTDLLSEKHLVHDQNETESVVNTGDTNFEYAESSDCILQFAND